MKWACELSDTIAQVKARVRLVDAVRRWRVQLRSDARRLEGRCPMARRREDRTPSFNLSLDVQRSSCFGCLAGGDVLGISVVEGAKDDVVMWEGWFPFDNAALPFTHASRKERQGLLSLPRRSGGLPFLQDLDGDEAGGTHRRKAQPRGCPVCAQPVVAQGKDLGARAAQPCGYFRWTHSFSAGGEGQ
jgi:hypothetical protein